MSDEWIVELLAAALREPPVEFITDDESWEYVMARAGLAALRADGFEIYRPDESAEIVVECKQIPSYHGRPVDVWEFRCDEGAVPYPEGLGVYRLVPVGDSPKETDLCIDCEEVPPRPLPDPISEGAEVMLSESIAGRALYCEGCFEEADALAEGEQ